MRTVNPSGVAIDGAKVRELRKLAGFTLKDFAPQCGIGFQYLSQIERGDRQFVSPPTFAKICDALNIENRRDMLRYSQASFPGRPDAAAGPATTRY
ncbi:MAG: helix-turn-helix transcriptional regulator [Micromonosporaceae bacterium]|nr:helix-turn-helix transcriptional regulator [Micromonosporaceae bacterium]